MGNGIRFALWRFTMIVPQSGRSGFTLIETLLVLALAVVLVALALPALQTSLHQSKIRGLAQEVTVLMRQARLDAIKNSAQAVVRIVPPDEVLGTVGRVEAFSDRDSDMALSPGEPELGRFELPPGVYFKAPPNLEDDASVDGFTAAGAGPNIAVFQRDGSVEALGAFRLGDDYDNFLEVRVEPAATARIELRKARDEGGTWNWYASGDGSKPWEWN
jgi:prepilin-type N-terminal cleavage/methylation domain-containing protein